CYSPFVSVWEATLREAQDDYTLALVGGFLILLVVCRAAASDERRRLRSIGLFVALHLAMLPVAGLLGARGLPAYREVRLCVCIFGTLAGVGIASTLLFTVLSRLRLRQPTILRDVVGAVASLIAVFVLASRAGLNLAGLIATSAVVTAVIGL